MKKSEKIIVVGTTFNIGGIELTKEDADFVMKQGKKARKEILREARGLEPKEKCSPFGRSFFKKKGQ